MAENNTAADVAVIGGGQLARMLQTPALALDVRLRLLAEAEGASAAQVIVDHQIGDYTDWETLHSVADGVSVVTFDHEHVRTDHLRALEHMGYACRPGPDALMFAQDKAQMRGRLDGLDVPVPDYELVTRADELDEFAQRAGGYPVIVKTASGGYDGKGVWVIRRSDEAAELFALVQSEAHNVLVVEELVDFQRELSVLIARRPSGESVTYPVIESIQSDGICTQTIAPAPDLPSQRADEAEEIAWRIADELGVTGIMAVELFQTRDDRLLVNELAMRPHNTGHWTIEGAVTSQFENHLRAVLDEPLGPTTPIADFSVMVNLLGGRVRDLRSQRARALAAEPGAHVHLYGKQVRPGRKIGHITTCGHDLAEVVYSAQRSAAIMQEEA